MPARVELSFEDHPSKISFVFPGSIMRVCAEGDDGKLNGYITVACDRDDKCADIYSYDEPTDQSIDDTPSDISDDCQSDHLVGILWHEDTAEYPLVDNDYGPFRVIIEHCLTMSSN